MFKDSWRSPSFYVRKSTLAPTVLYHHTAQPVCNTTSPRAEKQQPKNRFANIITRSKWKTLREMANRTSTSSNGWPTKRSQLPNSVPSEVGGWQPWHHIFASDSVRGQCLPQQSWTNVSQTAPVNIPNALTEFWWTPHEAAQSWSLTFGGCMKLWPFFRRIRTPLGLGLCTCVTWRDVLC